MIRGLRTVSRPIETEDQKFIHELNSDPVVRSNVVGWDMPTALAHQLSWFHSTAPGLTHRWLVEDLAGTPLGVTGLWDIDWHSRNALTALKLGGGTPRRGEGFGRDAILAVMAFAFYDVGLERLYSSILATNEASLRAYTVHCGWSVEGRSRKHVWRAGAFVDLLQVGVLRADFDAHPQASQYIELASEQRAQQGGDQV